MSSLQLGRPKYFAYVVVWLQKTAIYEFGDGKRLIIYLLVYAMDVQLTSSRPRRAGKRSGTQAEKGVSAPPLLWLCTLTLSWEETDDPEPNRTLRLGLPHLRKARLYLSVWQRHCCCSWIWKQDLDKEKKNMIRPPHSRLQHQPNGKRWITMQQAAFE